VISNAEPADRLLTIDEVAELTGLAVGTLYHLVSQKRIPVIRISSRCIRFRLSNLERWFAELTEEAETCNTNSNQRKRKNENIFHRFRGGPL
jgi:excisionase family DNA binding protein